MAKLPKAAMTCGAVPVRTREASSAKVTSRTWCSPFSIPQSPQQVREPGGAGLLEGQAGDRVDGRGVPPADAQIAGLAGDLEDLSGVREAEPTDRDRLEGADLTRPCAWSRVRSSTGT
jgi:hypothetical protein